MVDQLLKKRRLVMHVDDDPRLLRIVAGRLSRRGYEVISVPDPREAMDRLVESAARSSSTPSMASWKM